MTNFRFGDDLDLDARAYELRRAGTPVRLERLPMEVLLYLIERRPDLVTRDEIAARVWGKDVHLDTDNSINVAIRKIRQALLDDADEPRIIRTVTGKGYRFVAPVVVTGAGSAAAESATPPALASSAEAASSPAPARATWRRWLVPAAALALLVTAGAWLWPVVGSRHPAPAGRRMLAVLPFDNLTGDPAQDYFSDGFTEEMITRLGNLSPEGLGVIARTSVIQYKAARAPLAQMGRELGVQYVLEGSVRREAGRVRITAQLVLVEDQTHLWARQYDREVSDVLRVQQEIAEAIAGEIRLAIDGRRPPAKVATLMSPDDVASYDQYLKGRYHLNRRTEEGFRFAVEAFQAAVALNPHAARAWVGLADTWALQGTYGILPPDEAHPKAREAAMRALEIDERLAGAHASLALINEFHDFDWQTAGERFRRAIELDPNDTTAHHWYAEHLGILGRFDEALAEIDRARQLDPMSNIVAADRGVLLYFARRHDEAIEQLRSVLERAPVHSRAHMIICAYVATGRFAEAEAQLETWRGLEQGPWMGMFTAFVQGRQGRLDEARRAFAEMEEVNRTWKRVPHEMRTIAFLGMGRNEEAIAVLQAACRARNSFIVYIKADPIYDPLRDDPRFADLLRCVNLDS